MALIVQKYGGSSVGTLDRIRHVAKKIADTKSAGHDVVVVVSAMYGETDRLIQLAHAIAADPEPREYDTLIATGEQVSMALLSIALNAMQIEARSFTGTQIGIQTDAVHSKARILSIDANVIQQELGAGRVVVIAGFQGVSPDGNITTLGRGGSDTTAVAIAASLNATECQIYTDVDGVYTTDPHVVQNASLLPMVSFEEMLEMASLGAKVLQMRSVELASKHRMPIRVLSTFTDGQGTLVTFEDQIMHKHIVSGIALSHEEAIINLSKLPQQTGIEGEILSVLADAHIEIDMIAQNGADFSFTVNRREFSKALKVMEPFVKKHAPMVIKTNARVAKLSLVGIGMRSHTGVAATMFKTLGVANIPMQMVTTSEIKISAIVDDTLLEKGVKALHNAFQLDKIGARSKEKTYFE